VYCSANNRKVRTQNSSLPITLSTLCSQLQGPLTLFSPNCNSNTKYTKLCIWNTKYILLATKIQNTEYMQCILNTYFKYLYFKYFTTLLSHGLAPWCNTVRQHVDRNVVCLRVVLTGHQHGRWTQVVCSEPYVVWFKGGWQRSNQ